MLKRIHLDLECFCSSTLLLILCEDCGSALNILSKMTSSNCETAREYSIQFKYSNLLVIRECLRQLNNEKKILSKCKQIHVCAHTNNVKSTSMEIAHTQKKNTLKQFFICFLKIGQGNIRNHLCERNSFI